MKISILQPGFMPWFGFFEQMQVSDKFVYYDDVQYTRRDWRNRNRLKSPYGAKIVSIPVRKPVSTDRLAIREALINNDHPWQTDLLEKIKQWYGKAEYFSYIYPEIEKVIVKEWKYLIDLDIRLIELFKDMIGIDTPCFFSSDIQDKSNKKNQRILDICLYHKADILYDGESSKTFLDLDLFKQNKIQVMFQQYCHPIYPQLWQDFCSHLSILDLLMNCKCDETLEIICEGAQHGPDTRSMKVEDHDR